MNARSAGFQYAHNARNSFVSEKYVSLRHEAFEILGSQNSEDSNGSLMCCEAMWTGGWVQYQHFEVSYCHLIQGWDSMLLQNSETHLWVHTALQPRRLPSTWDIYKHYVVIHMFSSPRNLKKCKTNWLYEIYNAYLLWKICKHKLRPQIAYKHCGTMLCSGNHAV
jgi:hypothetical protein